MQIKALCDQAAIVWRGLGTKTILKTMKLTAIFMLAFSLTISARGLSQTVTLSGKDVPLKKIFAEIEKQTGYFVVWSKDQISQSKPVDVQASKQPLESFIKQVLKDQPLEYTIENQTIFIRLKKTTPRKDHLSITVTADPVTGYVKDSNGEPLTGATVTIKGTSTSVATGINGYFMINAQPGQTLVFSFVGYETKELKVGSDAAITVVLEPSENALDEMVIVGYGTAVRRSNTGTVATVKNKDIVSQPVADPLAALQGRVAGLFVASSSGFRGSNYSVMLRGRNSISGGNDPLYIIDGVPFFSESIDQFTSAGGNQSPLASINPSDIERIDILKDADATAIYGSRGANGVILITTRKGKTGKTQFDFNIYTGASKVTNKVDMLSTPEYIALRKEAFANDGETPDDEIAPDLFLWDQNKTTNWQDMIIGNTAKLTQVQASVSGGNEQTRFLLSSSYRNETTVLPNDLPFRRGAVYLNLDHSSINKKFNITASVSYSGIKDRSLASDLTSFYNIAPNYPIYDDDGKFYWYRNEQNPIAYLQRRSTSKTKNLVANSVVRYTILPGLSVKTRLGYTQTNMDQLQVYPNIVFNPVSSTGSMTYFGNSEVSSYIIEPQVDYTRRIGDGKLQLLAGGSWQETIREGESFVGENFSSDALLEDIRSAGKLTLRPTLYKKYHYNAFFGRVNYNWKEKYIVNATFRRDGSTRFGPGYRFGNFGAVGAAWLFTEEDFFPENHVISFGKLKASYGTTGNDQIDDYKYLETWKSTSFAYDGVSGIYPARLANPLFRWEENKKLEASLELGFLNDKILFTTNFYRNISDNQLVDFALTPQVGFTEMTANFPATVLNTGWEFELNSTNISNKEFTWKTALNLTVNKNKLKSFPGLESSSYKDRFVIGQSLTIIRGFQFNRIDPQTGLPEFEDIDKSGGISDPDDFVTLGKTMPDYYGGFRNTFSYKGFELDFLFQFVNQDGSNINYGYLSNQPGALQNMTTDALNRWRKPGDIVNAPKASLTADGADYRSYRLSSAMWGDASYIRLKNLSLRYDLSKLVKRYKLNNLSVYVLGQNLITITSYDGFDPETQGLVMPPMKTITAGLQFNF